MPSDDEMITHTLLVFNTMILKQRRNLEVMAKAYVHNPKMFSSRIITMIFPLSKENIADTFPFSLIRYITRSILCSWKMNVIFVKRN